jgi:hypothetical protein
MIHVHAICHAQISPAMLIQYSCTVNKSYEMHIQQLPCTDSSGHAIYTPLPGGGAAKSSTGVGREMRGWQQHLVYAGMFANLGHMNIIQGS